MEFKNLKPKNRQKNGDFWWINGPKSRFFGKVEKTVIFRGCQKVEGEVAFFRASRENGL